MEHPVIENVFKPGHGQGFAGMDGLGFGGGGALGLIALLALLGGRGGFGGFGVGGDGVAGLNNLQGAIDTNAILSNLGDLKASVPLTACQTQNTVTAAAADITSQALQQTMALMNQGAQGQLFNAQGFAAVGDKCDAGFAAQALATANSQFAVTQVVNNDGEKTRALIQSIDKTNDSRAITALQNEIVELRNEGRRRDGENGIRIDMIQNQNQSQAQAQQQQFLLAQLLPLVSEGLQVARATNSNVIVGNTGATTTGTQTANPTNVRA